MIKLSKPKTHLDVHYSRCEYDERAQRISDLVYFAMCDDLCDRPNDYAIALQNLPTYQLRQINSYPYDVR